MKKCVIALGSNLGNRQQNIANALRALHLTTGILVEKRSKLHQTAPVGVTDQPPFLNGAACLRTALSPNALLARMQQVENQLGRVRRRRWGPRTIDLDLIFYADRVIKTQDLIVPHALMHERFFVLAPLVEIAPEWVHPIKQVTVRSLWEQIKPFPQAHKTGL